MVVLYTLFVGGVLWALSMQVALWPVGTRRIFGVMAASLYVIGFLFVWLTTLTWCAVERRRVLGDGTLTGPEARRRASWGWQGLLILAALWFGTGTVEAGAGLASPRGVLMVLGGLVILGLIGWIIVRIDLPSRIGTWLTPFVPLAVGAVLYVVLVALIEWVGLEELLSEFNAHVRSAAVFMGVAAFVALLVGWFLRRGRGEEPIDAPDVNPPLPAAVGWALAPMLMPVVAFACLHYLPMDGWWVRAVASHGQVGLMFHAMLPPLFPGAVLVAWGLDRRSGAPGWPGLPVAAVTAMLLWIVFGPEILWQAHSRPEVTATEALSLGTPTDPFWGWDLANHEWVRLPLDGLARATGVMVLALSTLATTLLVRLGRGDRGSMIPPLVMLVVLQVALSAVIQPKFGPLGAPLAAALAAFTVWLYEMWSTGPSEPGVGAVA